MSQSGSTATWLNRDLVVSCGVDDGRDPGGAPLGATVAAVERDVFRGEVAGWAGQHLLAGG
jgi:hypothetical protein